MTMLEEPPAASPRPVHRPARERPDRRLRRRRWALFILLVLVPVSVVVLPQVDDWVTGGRGSEPGPGLFAETAYCCYGYSGPQPDGRPLHMMVAAGPLPPVLLISAQAVVAPGSGPMATGVSLCRATPDGSIGLVDDLAPYCSEVLDVAGRDLSGLVGRHHLVLTVAPLADVWSRIEGVDLTYEHQGRLVTERIQGEFTVEPAAG